MYSQSIQKFNDEEIEYLKLINDWNKEINYDKCIRKDITKTKQKISNEKEIQDIIIDDFGLVEGEYSLFMDYLTANIDESKYVMYGCIRKREKEGIYFVGLVENDDAVKLNIVVLSNVYDYKTEFVQFKKLNNWY